MNPKRFINAWVHKMQHDFEKDGQQVTWAPGFAGPKKWGEEHSKAVLPGQPTSNLAISPDGALLAIGANNDIHIYDAATLNLRRRLRGHVGRIHSVHFHHNGGLLASSTSQSGRVRDATTCLWDLGEEEGIVETAQNAVDSVAKEAVEPLLQQLAIPRGWTAQDIEAETATIRTGFEEVLLSAVMRREGRRSNASENADLPHSYCDAFEDAQLAQFGSYPFSRDGTLLFYIHGRRGCVVYDLTARRERFRIAATDSITWLGDSPDSRKLAVVSWDRTVHIWSIDTGNLERELKGSTSQNWSGAWSPNGTLLAVGSGDGKVRVWDAQTGQLVHALGGFSIFIRALSFAPVPVPDAAGGPLYLAAGAGSGAVRVFDVHSGECRSCWQVDDHQFPSFLEVPIVRFGHGPLGAAPVLGFKVGDGRLVIYNAEQNVKWEFEQDMDRENRVPGSGSFVFLHDSRSLVSADQDGTLRKWSLLGEA